MSEMEGALVVRGFRIVDVMRGSWRLFLSKAPLYLLMAAAVSLPMDVVLRTVPWFSDITAVSIGGMLLLNALTNGLTGAFIIYPAIQELQGNRSPTPNLIAQGMRLVFPAMAVAVVCDIIIVMGTIALIVPGVILFCVLWVAVPVSVIERVGVRQSIRRSNALTNGKKLEIAVLCLLLLALYALAVAAVAFVLSTLFGASFESVENSLVFVYATDVIATAAISLVVAYSYCGLVIEKDGLDISKVTAHFD